VNFVSGKLASLPAACNNGSGATTAYFTTDATLSGMTSNPASLNSSTSGSSSTASSTPSSTTSASPSQTSSKSAANALDVQVAGLFVCMIVAVANYLLM
jgi:hypothetical protein